ncbi:MAG: DUF1786 domain-containing protein [Chloroflexi bacterium]|nr:DUF1786 domain-containing protein [Chloroflexota bacterium]
MRLLAIDIGTGTQDILLFDTSLEVENCPKMVMPSPTSIVARKIEDATKKGRDVFLFGFLMGGGPCGWAAQRHIEKGLKVYATPQAARTFNDDLSEVERMGVTIVGQDEGRRLRGVECIALKDLDLLAVCTALKAFGGEPDYDALAVAVLDHGEAPPDYSDRLFRFDHFRRVLEQRNELSAFFYTPNEIPPYLTRMKAVIESAGEDLPFLLADTCVAAAVGIMEDRKTRGRKNLLLINLGNMHTLAFCLAGGKIEAFFEHHTGGLNTQKLDSLLSRFIEGSLSHNEVFQDMGHGVLYAGKPKPKPFVAATGPQRHMMAISVFKPYFASPHGDMMLTGCFGLVRAFAQRYEKWREEIENALDK